MAVSGLLTLTVPLLLAGVGLCGVLTGTDVFSALTDGARDGLKTVMRIFPALVALLTAVSMLRASGALEALTRLCAPVLAWLGIPPETAMLLLVRPISGSGALAAASDIIQTYGADSRIGRTAAVTSDTGSCAILRMSRTLSTGMFISAAISSALGSWPSSCRS